VKPSTSIHKRHNGFRSLTHVSKQIRNEFLSFYSKNRFQHTYSSITALKKFLKHHSTAFPENSEIKIAIFFKFLYTTLDFGPIFELIREERWTNLEVSFRCEGKPSTIAETMNRAIQQESLWRGSTLQVERIRLHHYDDTRLTVHLACGPCYSQQDRDERENASSVWSSLGFAVR
jgi:hypothetical protein